MPPERFPPTAGASTSTQRDDLLTVAALAVLAFISTDIAHEVIGHGIGLFIAGGRSGVLTTTRLIYQPHLPGSAWRLFDLGGPVGNLFWAALCFLAQRLIHLRAPRLRLFLWASMSFSLLWEFSYLMKCAVTGYGDGMAAVSGIVPAWAGRVLLFVIGLILYRAAIAIISSHLHFVVSSANTGWRSRVIRLILIVYLAGGAIACAGAIFDPRGRIEMLNSGALTSFGSSVGLFAVPLVFPLYSNRNLAGGLPICRSAIVIGIAILASVFFIAVLGPGIHIALR